MNPAQQFDLHGFHPVHFGGMSLSRELPAGDAGVAETIAAMCRLVDNAVKDPQVNRLAIGIVRGHGAWQPLRDLQSLYAYWQACFRYVEDPVGPLGPKETLRPVRDLLELCAGDCDDSAMVMAALAGTLGYETRFVTVAADASDPSQFSHVYSEALIQPHDGSAPRWVAMDCARPGARFGLAPQYYYRRKVWGTQDGSAQSAEGRGRVQGLSGYAVLGDDSTIAQDIQASGVAAANVIAASNPQSTYYGSSAGAAPGIMAPGIGYPGLSPYGSSFATPIGSAALTGSGSLLLFALLGIGALLLLRK
jgi:hypothetical protein